ncbi:MAG: hypothetical protein WC942_11430, partial [Clostridia bacterium]
MINCNQIIRCKLDGKQSVSIPISLKKNGRYLTDPVAILVKGFLKFNDIYTNGDTNYSVSNINDKNTLEDKTIVYPVLFSSQSATVYNGKGTITLLPRSEDLLYDYETLNKRLNSNYTISQDEKLNIENTKIIIETGKIRSPYKISIYVSIIDDVLYGETVDYVCDNSKQDSLWEKYEKNLSSNLLIECYNEGDWVPYVEKLNLEDNNGSYEEIVSIIDNIKNETPFGISPMYDAISLSANTLSDNSINEIRKVIYVIADNEVNSSIKTIDEMIEDVNAIDGDKKTPIILGNICTSDQKTLSSKSNNSDTRLFNKICYLTGGQAVSVISDNSTDEALSIFYGETVGSMGYGEFVFVIDMEENVTINDIESIFEIPDSRNNATWKVSFSVDGYSFEDYGKVLTKDEKIENFDRDFRYLKFTITLITGFNFDEYFSEIDYPFLKNIIITYNEKKISYLYLTVSDDDSSPSQMVIGVDSNSNVQESVNTGIALSDSHNWNDFYNDSRKNINQNGKIFIPLRFSEKNEQYKEKLIRVSKFAFKTSYGSWDKGASISVYDENDNIIPSNNYTVFYREGLVVFNYAVDNDYITGDYKISI